MDALQECEVCHNPLDGAVYRGQCAACLLSLALGDAPEEKEPEGSTRTLDDFELLEQIGQGGMGVVYKARQRSLNREVAIKMVLPGSHQPWDRFKIEAEAGAKLHHPNIIPIYEIGGEKDRLYLSMQLIASGNLKQRFAEIQLWPAQKIRDAAEARERQQKIATFCVKLARAAHFAHERGILHRDLKPENILVREDGEPMLTDFGLAKIWDHTKSLTGSDQVFGTLNYMAPEQAAGGRLSRGADIFSLGAILYELLAGKPPFKAPTPAQTLRQLAEEDPTPLCTVNHWIDADLAMVCAKCLQKNFNDRYSTAAELADDLDRWVRGETVLARPLSYPLRVRRWVARNRGATVLFVLLAAGLITTSISLSAVVRQKSAKERALDALRASVAASIYYPGAPRGDVEITSEQLAALLGGGPTPLPLNHKRLKLAVFVHQNPMETVDQYQRLLPYLENEIAQRIKHPVRLDLWLYRELTVESLIRDKAHFVRISPLFYGKAAEIGLQLKPLVRQANSTMEGVIFARGESSLKTVADLSGRSLMFGEENSIVTLAAQRLLAANGITCGELVSCVYLEPSVSSEYKKGGYFSRASEPLKAVVAGNYDAGVALERQIHNAAAVTVLARFACSTPFWAGTGELDKETAEAFTGAMEALNDPLILRALPEDPQQPNGFSRTVLADYADILSARVEAAQFQTTQADQGSK